MLAAPAIDSFELLEHDVRVDPGDGPRQRMTRALKEEEVTMIRELAATLPAYRSGSSSLRTCAATKP